MSSEEEVAEAKRRFLEIERLPPSQQDRAEWQRLHDVIWPSKGDQTVATKIRWVMKHTPKEFEQLVSGDRMCGIEKAQEMLRRDTLVLHHRDRGSYVVPTDEIAYARVEGDLEGQGE